MLATLQIEFEKAVADSKNLASVRGNDVLLQLYSLYKQATSGDAPSADLNPFDFIGRAKHDAWEKLKGTQTTEAMQQYIDLVNHLKG
jgi:acyl-CoA-binding protein